MTARWMNVKFFFKLPSRFKVATLWAATTRLGGGAGERRAVYFVAETKSTTVRANRRPAENLKIDCAREHFALANDLQFKDVTSLNELMG